MPWESTNARRHSVAAKVGGELKYFSSVEFYQQYCRVATKLLVGVDFAAHDDKMDSFITAIDFALGELIQTEPGPSPELVQARLSYLAPLPALSCCAGLSGPLALLD
jgi:hypothetical protein